MTANNPHEPGSAQEVKSIKLGRSAAKSAGPVLVTCVVFGIAIWWLAIVLSKIGVAPTVSSKGAAAVDQYQRAKDILQFVLPLATAAVGYWFGNHGASKVQEQAQQAHNKLNAVLDASTEGGLLTKARASFPSAFADMT
jgi:hypothetical protein